MRTGADWVERDRPSQCVQGLGQAIGARPAQQVAPGEVGTICLRIVAIAGTAVRCRNRVVGQRQRRADLGGDPVLQGEHPIAVGVESA